MQGNECHVDANGFIIPQQSNTSKYSRYTVFRTESKDGKSAVLKFNPNKTQHFVHTTNCWI